MNSCCLLYCYILTDALHNLRPRWSAFLSFEDTGARHRLRLCKRVASSVQWLEPACLSLCPSLDRNRLDLELRQPAGLIDQHALNLEGITLWIVIQTRSRDQCFIKTNEVLAVFHSIGFYWVGQVY